MIKSLCEMKPFLWYYSNEVNQNIEYYYMLSSGMEGFRFDIGKLKISSKNWFFCILQDAITIFMLPNLG